MFRQIYWHFRTFHVNMSISLSSIQNNIQKSQLTILAVVVYRFVPVFEKSGDFAIIHFKFISFNIACFKITTSSTVRAWSSQQV